MSTTDNAVVTAIEDIMRHAAREHPNDTTLRNQLVALHRAVNPDPQRPRVMQIVRDEL